MNQKSLSLWIFRIILGGLFIYAGARKILDPLEFADAIAGFQFLPNVLIHPIAIGMPVFELVLGLLILLPTRFWAQAGAFGIILLNMAFIILLVSAWMRGLTVECGCFGTSFFPPSQWTLQIAILRDLVLLAMATRVYFFAKSTTHKTQKTSIQKKNSLID